MHQGHMAWVLKVCRTKWSRPKRLPAEIWGQEDSIDLYCLCFAYNHHFSMFGKANIWKGILSFLAWYMSSEWKNNKNRENWIDHEFLCRAKVKRFKKNCIFKKPFWGEHYVCILHGHHYLSLGKSKSQHAHYWTHTIRPRGKE